MRPREFSGGWLRDIVREPGWGRWRAPLHPSTGTETFGHDGFFMHGDDRLQYQTAGCVDVGDCDGWARDWAMERPDEPIPFQVDYAFGEICN